MRTLLFLVVHVHEMEVILQLANHDTDIIERKKLGRNIDTEIPISNAQFFFIQGRKILSEFLDIMEESHDSIKITDKTEWWQSRWKLDDRLRVRLTQIQDKCSTHLGNV